MVLKDVRLRTTFSPEDYVGLQSKVLADKLPVCVGLLGTGLLLTGLCQSEGGAPGLSRLLCSCWGLRLSIPPCNIFNFLWPRFSLTKSAFAKNGPSIGPE